MPFDPTTAIPEAPIASGKFDPTTATLEPPAPSQSPTIGQSVGPEQSLSDFQKQPLVQQAPAPTIGKSVGPEQSISDFKSLPLATPPPLPSWKIAPPGETDYDAMHRLEGAAIGTAIDAKGNPISPDEQDSAQQEWINHYINDVTKNGPMARMARFTGSLGQGLKNSVVNAGEDTAGFLAHPINAIESGASKAGSAVGGLVDHPINSLARGLGTGIVDVGHAIANLVSGGAEQLFAGGAQNTSGEPNSEGQIESARLAAKTALARMIVDAKLENATTPINPTPGFGTARFVGGIATGSSLAPGPIGKVLGKAGDIGEAVAPKVVGAAGSIASAPFKAVWAPVSHLPGSAILRTAASLAPKAAEAAPVAAEDLVKAKAFLEDAPQLRSVALQRVTNAEQAVQDATEAGEEAGKMTPLLKEAQDAHQELSKLNMGEALYQHTIGLAESAAKPTLGQKVLAGVGRVAGNGTAGAVGGVGYQGLAGNPGDPNAATQGALQGGAMGAIADMYLKSVNGLKQAGDAYIRAQTSIGKSMPTELPEDDHMIFPVSKAVQEAQNELAGSAKSSAENTGVAQPESTGKTVVPPLQPILKPAGSMPTGNGGKIPMWESTRPFGAYSEPGATFTREGAEKLGLPLPPHPDETGSPLAAPKAPPQAGPTISIDPPTDHPAPDTFPSGREVKVIAGATVPLNEGDIPFSTKLPGQHEKINFIKYQMPTEFDPTTHGITAKELPSNETSIKLAASQQPVTSTKITGISYDPQKQLLGVGMRDGKYYIHKNVPPELHDRLMQEDAMAKAQAALPKPQQTASVGKLYNSAIRGNPDYKFVTTRTPLLDSTGKPLPEIAAAAEQIKAHDMRQESLQSALQHGYDTPENIAQRAANELKEHQAKLKGILGGTQEGPTPTPGNALKPNRANVQQKVLSPPTS